MLTYAGLARPAACTCCGLRTPVWQAAAAGASIPPPTNIEAMEGKSRAAGAGGMIIDCHGHYTTEPQEMLDWRKRQVAAINDPAQRPSVDSLELSDDQLRASVEGAQLKLQRERGTSLTLFSPRASGMSHHIGDASVSEAWSRLSNTVIYRLTKLYPDNFAGVCQLPQSPGVQPKNCIAELKRCVGELGFVGCNLNPDPSGGYWTDPPLTDEWWFPLYEKMVELDVPAMIHVAASCNPAFHHTGAHYLNGDTTAFMQLLQHPGLFRRFPTLRFILPHGGGAVPYHWGRYRGIAQDQGWPGPETLLPNVFFDTCVYDQLGIQTLVGNIGADNILFASEMIGAVRGKDPTTGRYFDDTKPYLDALNL